MILSIVSKIDMCCRSWHLVSEMKYSIARAKLLKDGPDTGGFYDQQGEVLAMRLFAEDILLVYP